MQNSKLEVKKFGKVVPLEKKSTIMPAQSLDNSKKKIMSLQIQAKHNSSICSMKDDRKTLNLKSTFSTRCNSRSKNELLDSQNSVYETAKDADLNLSKISQRGTEFNEHMKCLIDKIQREIEESRGSSCENRKSSCFLLI